MKSKSNVLWGVVLIAIGLIMTINALGVAHIDVFFEGWWTLFIIIPAFIGLIDGDDKYGSIIWLIIGVALLLSCRGVISFHLLFKLLIPFLIIMIGLSVLHKGIFGEKVKEKVEIKDPKELETIAVVMSDESKIVKSDFKGAIVDTVFGHCTLDLSEAKIKQNASLKISSIFGKVDVILPEGVTIKMNSTRVFGSVNQVMKDTNVDKKEKIVFIEAVSVFGGISLR